MTATEYTPPFCDDCLAGGCLPSVCSCKKGCHANRPAADLGTRVRRTLGLNVPADNESDMAIWRGEAS